MEKIVSIAELVAAAPQYAGRLQSMRSAMFALEGVVTHQMAKQCDACADGLELHVKRGGEFYHLDGEEVVECCADVQLIDAWAQVSAVRAVFVDGTAAFEDMDEAVLRFGADAGTSLRSKITDVMSLVSSMVEGIERALKDGKQNSEPKEVGPGMGDTAALPGRGCGS